MSKFIKFKQGIYQNPTHFTVVDVGGNTKDIKPDFGTVIQDGTPFSPENLNAMARQISYTVEDTSGTVNTFVVALDSLELGDLEDNLKLILVPNTTNTGACTINPQSLGVIAIKKQGNEDLVAGDIVRKQQAILNYSTEFNCFELLNPQSANDQIEDSKTGADGRVYTGLPERLDTIDTDIVAKADQTQVSDIDTRVVALEDDVTKETYIPHTQNESIKSLPTGSLEGSVKDLSFDGLTLVNEVEGKDIANGGSVSFDSISGDIYYDSLNDTNITGDGTTKTITNNTGATVDIVVINKTSLNIESYTTAQMSELTQKYIDGMKSVENPEIEVVGKNLFDVSNITNYNEPYLGNVNGRPAIVFPYSIWSYKDMVFYDDFEDGKQYTLTSEGGISGSSALYYKLIYKDGSTINFWSDTKDSITSSSTKNLEKILITSSDNGDGYIYTDTLQLEEGTTATAYEPYKSHPIKINETFRRLPNGTKDSCYMQNNEVWKDEQVGEYVLQAEDIISLVTSPSEVNYVRISLPISAISYTAGTELSGSIMTEFSSPAFTPYDTTILQIGLHCYGSSTLLFNDFIYVVAKGTYASLAEAQADLTDTVIQYELATPQQINLTDLGLVEGELISEENGTCYLSGDSLFPQNVSFEVPANTGAAIGSLVESSDYQAKQISTKASKVQEEWIEPTLTNGWSGTNVKYYKDDLGRVYLNGELSGGNGGAFVLPEGYRPQYDQKHISLTIDTGGKVTPSVTKSLDGVSFRTEG